MKSHALFQDAVGRHRGEGHRRPPRASPTVVHPRAPSPTWSAACAVRPQREERAPYYDIEEVLVVRGVKTSPSPITKLSSLDDPVALRLGLGAIRDATETYAADLLRGDLAAYETLDPLLKARYLR